MAKTFFVTGTDTDAGKTFATCAMLALAKHLGQRTIGLKPVAAGAEQTADGLRNEDALALQQYSSLKLAYARVNPVLLTEPVAPHIAASKEGRALTVAKLTGFCRGALMTPHDLSFIEGAGGWLVPLNSQETLADLAVDLQVPVILVIGLRLGCLNHALLTANAIRQSGLPLAGWIASQCQSQAMTYQQENLATLGSALDSPCLGVLPFASSPASERVTGSINLEWLL